MPLSPPPPSSPFPSFPPSFVPFPSLSTFGLPRRIDSWSCSGWRRTCRFDPCITSKAFPRTSPVWREPYMEATRSSSGSRRCWRCSLPKPSIHSTFSKYSPWRCGEVLMRLGVNECFLHGARCKLCVLVSSVWRWVTTVGEVMMWYNSFNLMCCKVWSILV